MRVSVPGAGRGHPPRQEVHPEADPPGPDSPPPPPLDKTPFVSPSRTVCQKVIVLLLLKEKRKPSQSPIPTPSSSHSPAGLREHGDIIGQEEVCTTGKPLQACPSPWLFRYFHSPWAGSTPALRDPSQDGWMKRTVGKPPSLLPPKGLTDLLSRVPGETNP